MVNENGRRKTISKRDAIIMQLVNKAVSGDLRSIKLLLEEFRELGEHLATDDNQISLEALRWLMNRADGGEDA